MTSTMSWAVSVRCSSGRSKTSFLLSFNRPTGDKIVALGVQEQIVEQARAVSTDGVSPGRRRR